ncbi:hypothetical protein XELAEV_18007725mg [Xenopus laevis]|uniref:Uncharacterized protein n=1 Tax=Xenopus laevis TaxID=8355 RepID=A0A974I5B2_XENLA|nr:hypothetical protein XELAEV_18007725mg [Xenopus laevis]
MWLLSASAHMGWNSAYFHVQCVHRQAEWCRSALSKHSDTKCDTALRTMTNKVLSQQQNTQKIPTITGNVNLSR